MQLAIQWSLGKPSFGLKPTRPLRTLIIQAENDAGDMWEMVDGMVKGLKLTHEERETTGQSVFVYDEDSWFGDNFFTQVVRPLVERHRPDIIAIDPAFAYVEGDTTAAEKVGKFLRRNLNPILREFGCAAIVVHHTTKQRPPRNRALQTTELLYAGAGSAEFTNWARAVLALESKGDGRFRLHAPKRGKRLGWTDDHGAPTLERLIKHTPEPDQIYWEDVSPSEIESVGSSGKSKTDLLALVPEKDAVSKNALIASAQRAGIGEKKARAFLDELLEDKSVHLWLIERSGTNAERWISRFPPPQEGPCA
jgi:hypothetical protein